MEGVNKTKWLDIRYSWRGPRGFEASYQPSVDPDEKGKKQIKNANLRSFHLHVQDVDGDEDDDEDFRLSRSKVPFAAA